MVSRINGVQEIRNSFLIGAAAQTDTPDQRTTVYTLSGAKASYLVMAISDEGHSREVDATMTSSMQTLKLAPAQSASERRVIATADALYYAGKGLLELGAVIAVAIAIWRGMRKKAPAPPR